MDNYEEQFQIEEDYLKNIKGIIEKQLFRENERLKNKKRSLVAGRKDMYENTTHYSQDFEKLSDAIAYLNPLERQALDYSATQSVIRKLVKMGDTPYFAKVVFHEEGFNEENIYIGLGNLADPKTYQTYICDWRAPISSIFYRYGLGKASYKSPNGVVEGEISLKRQFEIKKGELKFFFDSSMTIYDDILKHALSQNSSAKMKSIVETIQKDQDFIIRDVDSDLLIVQGVAGSGKTSIALHRVAYLMYYGLTEKLNESNIILITPNNLFEKYIDSVLPELGEKNIRSLTMEELCEDVFGNQLSLQPRTSLLEEIITGCQDKKELVKSKIEFVLSSEFMTILDRYIKYYEHRLIDFRDIFYDGECIVNRHLAKAELLRNNDISLPLEKRLETIEKRVMQRIHELRKKRLIKLERFLSQFPEHMFEIKQLARLLSLKENKAIAREIQKFSRVDALDLYKKLIVNKKLFYRMAEGIKLPNNIDEILESIKSDLQKPVLNYDDAMVVLALKLKLSGYELFKDIMQVVVDEAQDYYPLHYDILRLAFKNARFTVMGDINQTIGRTTDLSAYKNIKNIMNKKTCSTMVLNKSFRSSFEINQFSQNFCSNEIEIDSFERHDNMPEIIRADTIGEMEQKIINKVGTYKAEGYRSIAIVCKSFNDAEQLFDTIGKEIGATLINSSSFDSIDRVMILPVYMAKGLEFDAVLISNTNDDTYKDTEDRQLLYVACTRALHRLSLFYIGNKSRFLPDNS